MGCYFYLKIMWNYRERTHNNCLGVNRLTKILYENKLPKNVEKTIKLWDFEINVFI